MLNRELLLPEANEIHKMLAERKLNRFVERGWPNVEPMKYQGNWHIDAMCEHFEACANRQIKRLMINVPPRHMKSLGANVFMPAWIWAQDPDPEQTGHGYSVQPGTWKGPGVKFMYLSYSGDLTSRDSAKCRVLLDSKWYQSKWGDRWNFRADQNQKTRYENDKGGYRIATSVNGRVTGDGGDIIVFDDPHNVKETESQTVREETLRFWDESMPTRLNDAENGVFIVIMQRVHHKDLSGHILAKELGWDHLCLPAEYEPDHIYPVKSSLNWEDPRAPGEPLWPARFNKTTLDSWSRQLGTYASAGQLQQRPSPREGGAFKRQWFEIVPAVPATAVVKGRAWDLAGTEEKPSTDPDYTVGVRGSYDPITGITYIEHVARDRVSPAGVKTLIKNTATQDGHLVRIRLPIDPGSAGKFQVRELVTMLQGYAVTGEADQGSKEVRADPVAAQAEVGNIKLVKSDWNEAFLEELTQFPTGGHDDQVDALTALYRLLIGLKAGGVIQTTYANNT